MAGSLIEVMMTYVDLSIARGKEAGLRDEQIIEAVSNRLGRGAGMRAAAGGGTGEALALTAAERDEHKRLFDLAIERNGLDEFSAARLAALNAKAYGRKGGDAA